MALALLLTPYVTWGKSLKFSGQDSEKYLKMCLTLSSYLNPIDFYGCVYMTADSEFPSLGKQICASGTYLIFANTGEGITHVLYVKHAFCQGLCCISKSA